MLDIPTIQENSEQLLLGCIISDAEARNDCMFHLKPDDFSDSKCKAIYSDINAIMQQGHDINVVSLSLCGHDLAFLCTLTMNVLPASYRTLLNAVLTESAKRKALSALNNTIMKLNSTCFFTPEEINAEIANLSIKSPCINRQKPNTLLDIMAEFPHELEKEASGQNLKYGWRDLDGLTGGLWPGELTIPAAAPGAGKTAFALNIGLNVAKQGGKVVFVSLEMNNLQLAKRLCSHEGKIEGNKLRRPQELNETDWIKIPEITEQLAKLPIVIDNTKTIQELQNKCTRLKEKNDIDLLIVDYLGLLRSLTKTESRRHEVEFVSRSLKLLALELDIPIIALSQLNREGQKAPAPTLNDLRESGSLEQDADNVVFLHDPQARENLSAAWVDINVILAKQRSGQTGRIKMRFDKRFMKFYELER